MNTATKKRMPQYDLPFKPLLLKQVTIECGISQNDLREAVEERIRDKVSRPTINLCLNRGYIPTTMTGFVEAVEAFIAQHPKTWGWLYERELPVSAIWGLLEGSDLRQVDPADHWHRTSVGTRAGKSRAKEAIRPGKNEDIESEGPRMEKLPQEVLKHFKLFRDPFIDDVLDNKDVYRSDEHHYIEQAMLETAQHTGFLAVIGEVGSGKSIMRRAVIDQLKRDNKVLVIYPQIIDKERLTASSICDAIIYDISSEKPKVKLEAKSRQVQQLLQDRASNDYRAVLIIEEAHDLSIQTLKFLKRFHEMEHGFRKLLGIILLGQTELQDRFDEAQNVDMREVIRRVQVATIRGLNGNTKEYLALKFKRVGGNVEAIFEDEALKALSARLTSKGQGGKAVSYAYPLTVNNYASRLMIMAHELGQEIITAEVVNAY